jgi:hypothetical protein
MAVTPFRHIDIANHEPITKEKLDQYQSNIQWVIDHTPVTLHVNDARQSSISNLIIVGGRIKVPFKGGAAATVWFNGAFDSSTLPIVTTGINSEVYKQLWCTMSGVGTTTFPDARGFELSIRSMTTLTTTNPYIWVNWMAVGKRSATYERL